MDSNWQPIDTAPRDGTRVLLCPGDEWDVEAGYFYRCRFYTDAGCPLEATHWMPLPAGPAPKEASDGN